MNNPKDSIAVMLNDDGVAEIYDDTYDITIHCTSEEDHKKCEERLLSMRWVPIEEALPEPGEYVLVSFSNVPLPDIGRYEEEEDLGGAFYPGDEDYTYVSKDLYVNAWMPLPKRYKD